MAAWVCAACEIKYPSARMKCDVCDGDLRTDAGVPDADWEQRKLLLLRLRGASRLVVDWRRDQFHRAYPGFTDAELERLAESKVDVEFARRLAREGCPEDVAFRILA